MGSISEVWQWLIHLPGLGVVLLGVVVLLIVSAGFLIHDAMEQYKRS